MGKEFLLDGWSQVLVANNEIFTQILKEVLNFLVAKLGYPKLKSGSLSRYQVVYGLPLIHFLKLPN